MGKNGKGVDNARERAEVAQKRLETILERFAQRPNYDRVLVFGKGRSKTIGAVRGSINPREIAVVSTDPKESLIAAINQYSAEIIPRSLGDYLNFLKSSRDSHRFRPDLVVMRLNGLYEGKRMDAKRGAELLGVLQVVGPNFIQTVITTESEVDADSIAAFCADHDFGCQTYRAGSDSVAGIGKKTDRHIEDDSWVIALNCPQPIS